MESITDEEVMDKLDISQEVFGIVYEFGCWYTERIQTDAVTQFTSKEFQEGLYVRTVQL